MRVVAVLAFMLLAGCLQPTPTSGVDLSEHTRSDAIELRLSDFEGGDAILLEVVLEEAGTVRLDVEATVHGDAGLGTPPVDMRPRRDVCLGAHVGMSGESFFGLGLDALEARLMGQEAYVGASPSAAERTQRLHADAVVQAMQPVHVLVTLQDAALFLADGASATIKVHADQPMHFRRLAEPPLHCLLRPADFEGGTVVDAGAFRWIRDQHADWQVSDGGFGLVWSSTSQGAFDVRVARDRTLVAHQMTDELGPSYTQGVLFPMMAGTYRVDVKELSGITMPAWATFTLVYAVELPPIDSTL